MPNKAKQNHYQCLAQVVTMSEAARMYYRDRQTVRYAIDAGNLAARQCGRNWLVSVPSLIALWGNPPSR
jgi:hypothetical protein